MTTTQIAGVTVPDSRLAQDVTSLVRDTTNELIFHHSRRVFVFGSLQSQALGASPDPELLYVAAMLHDVGLVEPYRSDHQRFEVDGADVARQLLAEHGVAGPDADTVWTAIALHTTPEVPLRMDPVVAATTLGVETDVLGLRLGSVAQHIDEVVAAHPRPDFKDRILQAFHDGFAHRPDSTFGTVNADVLQHADPDFVRGDFVEVIRGSAWPS